MDITKCLFTVVLLFGIVFFGILFLLHKYIKHLEKRAFPVLSNKLESILLEALNKAYYNIYMSDIVVYLSSGVTLENSKEYHQIIRKFLEILDIYLGKGRKKYIIEVLFNSDESSYLDYCILWFSNQLKIEYSNLNNAMLENNQETT